MLVLTSCKTFQPGDMSAIEVSMLCHSVSKGSINLWYQRLGHTSMETLTKPGIQGEFHDCLEFKVLK